MGNVPAETAPDEAPESASLRVSSSGRVQITRNRGPDSEVLVELEVNQLETVVQWLYRAVRAVTSGRQMTDHPLSSWFGEDPVGLPPAAGGTLAYSGAPVEVLALLSRLPRDGAVLDQAIRPGDAVFPTEETTLNGFSGIRWGTLIEDIPELVELPTAGETQEGIPFYLIQTRLVNEAGFAAYYADPLTGELVGGAWVLSPSPRHHASVWCTLVDTLATAYPHLSMRDQYRYAPGDAGRLLPFADAHGQEVLTLRSLDEGGMPLVHVLYRSRRLIRRQALAVREDRRRLGPVGEMDALPGLGRLLSAHRATGT